MKDKINENYNPYNYEHRLFLAKCLEQKFASCGFSRTNVGTFKKGHEKGFIRDVDNTNYYVCVYSSINTTNNAVASYGSDAIRIFARNHSFGTVTSTIKVNRVGTFNDIVERTYQAMRNTYKEALTAYNIRCSSCGAQTLFSKRGKRYCEDICWDKG